MPALMEWAWAQWERKARKALVSPELVYFLWLAEVATPRTGHQWLKYFVNPFSNQNLCCHCDLQHNVHLIMVNGAQHCTVSEI